jgi:hypothetical protein
MRALWNSGGLPWWYARPLSWLLFEGLLLTIAAVIAAGWVFISVTCSMNGLREYNANPVPLIHERNHFVLVRPEWLSGGANATGADFDLEWRWQMAEMKARWAVVFILWAGSIGFFIWQHSRRRTQALPANPPGNAASAG